MRAISTGAAIANLVIGVYNLIMARPSNSTQRRLQIVAGLRTVLATQGYAGASTQDIARAAGLSASLVHYHFVSKQHVLLALVQQLCEGLMVRYETRAAAASTARLRLLAFIDAWTRLGKDADVQSMRCWLGICAQAVADRDVQQALSDVTRAQYRTLRGLVRAALSEAGAPAANVNALTLLLYNGMQGAFLTASVAPKLFARGSAAPALHQLVDVWLALAQLKKARRSR